jgi:hypothetical protein
LSSSVNFPVERDRAQAAALARFAADRALLGRAERVLAEYPRALCPGVGTPPRQTPRRRSLRTRRLVRARDPGPSGDSDPAGSRPLGSAA